MNINKIKGLHPGFILERELKKRKIKKSRFALEIHEFPQTLVAITKGKRKMNTPLALKIEQALGLDEGYFMIIQAFHEIEVVKRRQNQKRSAVSKLRRVLFWDTNFDKIDWELQKEAVIKRVFERGNDEEKKEITRFYGKEVINKIIA